MEIGTTSFCSLIEKTVDFPSRSNGSLLVGMVQVPMYPVCEHQKSVGDSPHCTGSKSEMNHFPTFGVNVKVVILQSNARVVSQTHAPTPRCSTSLDGAKQYVANLLLWHVHNLITWINLHRSRSVRTYWQPTRPAQMLPPLQPARFASPGSSPLLKWKRPRLPPEKHLVDCRALGPTTWLHTGWFPWSRRRTWLS